MRGTHKLRALLLACDRLEVDAADPLCQVYQEIFRRRNALAHPKATLYPRDAKGQIGRIAVTVHDLPRAVATAMADATRFCELFAEALPELAKQIFSYCADREPDAPARRRWCEEMGVV